MFESISINSYLLFTLILIPILYKYFTRNHNYWKALGIPGPKPLPFLGNVLEIFQKPLSEIEEQRFQDFGKIHGYYDFNQPILTVGEPELIKQILIKDFNSFVNRRPIKVSDSFFKSFLIVSRDEDWKRLRSITSPSFSSRKMKQMSPMINECVEGVLNKLTEITATGKEVDIKWLFGSYAMNVIAKCAFATDTNALEDKNNLFVVWASKVINAPLWRQIFVTLMPVFILDLLKFTIAVPESFGFFKNVAKHVLNDRKSDPNAKKYNDFLQLLVDAEKSDELCIQEISESNEELIANRSALKLSSTVSISLTEDEIISNIVLFLLVGYETTASLLSFSAYNLALNPDSQQKLYEEVKSCSQLNYESVSKLQYLDAIICETLRLHNPATRVEREANEDYVLGDTGITIKKNGLVAIPIHAIHHSSEFYPNPHQFRPERFIGEEKENIKPYSFLPFGGGPRNCIGMRFALLEAKLALAQVVKKFKLTKNVNTEIPLKFLNTRPNLLQAVSIKVDVEPRD